MKSRFLPPILLIVSLAVLLTSLAPVRADAAVPERAYEKIQCVSPARVKLQADLRRLWIDHTLWTRSYIVSAVAGLDDQKDVLARLLQNQ